MKQNYNVFTIDLSSAGEQIIAMFSGVLRLVRAVDASGALSLDALVEIRIGETVGDWIPLGYGNAVKSIDARQLTIRWTAQSGVTATFYRSRDPNLADVDARPPAQLVIGDKGSTVAASKVSVTTSSIEVVAVNTDRKSVAIRNLSADTVYLNASPATVNDYPLKENEVFIDDNSTAAWFGITAAGTADIRVVEVD